MRESVALRSARRLLGDAEADLESADGLARLAEGLELIDELAAAGQEPEAATARNLAASYASRVYARIGARLASDAQVPEPELEHYFKLALAFDSLAGSLPAAATELKLAVVRALIERYYEGHPPEQKRRALEELDKVARGAR
jgi:hypothetical protein